MKYIYVPIYARNVLFSPESEFIFKKLLRLAKNDQVKSYITHNLRNYIINYYPTTDLHLELADNDPIWIRKAVNRSEVIYNIFLTEEDWQKYKRYVKYLNTINPEIIPQLSVRDLDKKANELYTSLQQQSLIDSKENAKTIHKYKDGYRWVQLTSPVSMQYEIDCMNNGDVISIESNPIKPIGTNIISLRDNNNKSCADIVLSLEDKRILKILGNNGHPVDEEHLPLVIDFINKKYIPVDSIAADAFIRNGFFFSQGKAVCFKDFNGQFNGDIDLHSCDDIKLPDNIVINGNLDISDSKIKNLPKGLIIKGKLKLNNSRLKIVPEDISVRLLDLTDTRIRYLPQSLPNVKKVVIGKNTRLTTLPENFDVPNGTLEIQSGNRMTKLPLKMNIGRDLIINSNRITNLSRELTVSGNLYLDGSQIVISRLSDELKSKLK